MYCFNFLNKIKNQGLLWWGSTTGGLRRDETIRNGIWESRRVNRPGKDTKIVWHLTWLLEVCGHPCDLRGSARLRVFSSATFAAWVHTGNSGELDATNFAFLLDSNFEITRDWRYVQWLECWTMEYKLGRERNEGDGEGHWAESSGGVQMLDLRY